MTSGCSFNGVTAPFSPLGFVNPQNAAALVAVETTSLKADLPNDWLREWPLPPPVALEGTSSDVDLYDTVLPSEFECACERERDPVPAREKGRYEVVD